jgi:hypothetical protein
VNSVGFTFYEDDGVLHRREAATMRTHVYHPKAGKWRPWSTSPFSATEITPAEARKLVGDAVDLYAAGEPRAANA